MKIIKILIQALSLKKIKTIKARTIKQRCHFIRVKIFNITITAKRKFMFNFSVIKKFET